MSSCSERNRIIFINITLSVIFFATTITLSAVRPVSAQLSLTPTPSKTPTLTMTPTGTRPTQTPTPTPSNTPTLTMTPTGTRPTQTPTPSNTPTLTMTPTGTRPTQTPTPTPSKTPTLTMTPTGTRPTQTPTPTPSKTPTGTRPTQTPTPTPSKTPTLTMTPTPTPSKTPTLTMTPTGTRPTETPTPTPSKTPTGTRPTQTPTPTPSKTPTLTMTPTGTRPTQTPTPTPSKTPTLTMTPTGTRPTHTPTPTQTKTPTSTTTPTKTITPTPTKTATPTIPPNGTIPTRYPTLYDSPNERFGVVYDGSEIATPNQNQLNIEWNVGDYRTTSLGLTNTLYIIPLADHTISQIPERLQAVVLAHPGATWIIGNEMDAAGSQDSMLPLDYAVAYYNHYHAIKALDPTAKIAIGAITQPTPLRLAYLDQVFQSYIQEYSTLIPIDVWVVHNMILNEERNEWGAGIPLGSDAESGRVLTIDRSDNVHIFRQQLIDLRQKMFFWGQREKPLIVTGFGILLPDSDGYDDTRIINFMYGAFDVMLSEIDPQIGYSADGDRLVQQWAWFGFDTPEYNPLTGQGYNGGLFDPQTGKITAVGEAYARYTSPDVKPGRIGFEENPANSNETIITIDLYNQGIATAEQLGVQIWLGSPTTGGTQLSPEVTVDRLVAGVENRQQLRISWNNPTKQSRTLNIYLDKQNNIAERDEFNNATSALYTQRPPIYLPIIVR